MNRQTYCQTDLNYVKGMEAAPVNVTIMNGRECAPGSWQTHGFELMAHTSVVTDWDDEAAVAAVHYEEVATFARQLTGCDHAVVSGHIARNPEQLRVHEDLGPIHFVHSDFASNYGERMRTFYRDGGEDAAKALARSGIDGARVTAARRMLILQFWRNVGPTTMDVPLAFCDATTVAPTDVFAMPVTDYAGGGFDFDTLGVLAPDDPARHHWYTFPHMNVNEVAVFRTFDSDRLDDGRPFWTPHSAFQDPNVDAGTPARRSIEVRATCLFD
jgi:hypothetical protein